MQLASTDLAISTFELLVKPIAPRMMGNPAQDAVARRVVQGYFLTITNLESLDLTFRLDFRISTPNPADPDRTLFNNADLIFDIAGANNLIPLSGDATSNRFGGSFRLPAGQTASVQLLPKPQLFGLANPDFEVRGYVVLRLPALRRNFGFLFEPQTANPAKVLLSAEVRGTFLPNTFPAEVSGDFDQISYALPIASGQALNEVAPEPGRFVVLEPLPMGLPTSMSSLVEQPTVEEAMGIPELVGLVRSSRHSQPSASAATSLLD
jgi:hypothetical protein